MLALYLVFLFLVLVCGCKIAPKGTFHEDFLSYPVVKGLQGFAALAVILHHVTQEVTQYGQYDKGMINVFVDAGVLFTGMFFFFSGYGLVVSLMEKENYLNGFLKKRLPAVVVPFYVCNLLFIIVNLVMGRQVKPLELAGYVSGIVMWNDQMWFIVELAVLYTAFYFIFRKRKSDASALGRMAIFILVMNIVSLLLGHDGLPETKGLWFFGEWWYNTTWLFFIGMLVAKYKEKITGFAKKNYKWLLPLGLMLFVVLAKATDWMLKNVGYWLEYPGHRGYLEKLETFLVQCPMVIVFVLTLMLLSMKVQFKNRVLSFVGAFALEIYLLQNIFITKLTHVIDNDMVFFAAVYAGSIALAFLVHKVDVWLLKAFIKEKK